MTRPTPAPTTTLGSGFWRLWCSSSLSNLADGVFKVALPLVALRVTDSTALIAGVTAALTMPWLVFALPAGAVIDRLDRRTVMLWGNTVRAGVLVVLAVSAALDVQSIWLLYAAALAAGVAEVFHDTSAQSILPQVVRGEQLTRANGRLFAGELTANEFAGPPLGGALVSVGAVLAFTTPAGLWLAAVGILLLVKGSFRAERGEVTTLRADIADGLSLLWHNGILRSLSIITAGFNFASGAVMAILVVYAVGESSPMGLTDTQFGLLLTATAAGSLAGTFVADVTQRKLGRARTMVVGVTAAIPFIAAPAATSNAVVVAVCFFIGGVGLVVANVVGVSLRQRITPAAKLGRIIGAHRLVGWGTKPLGAAAGGVIAQTVGLRPTFALMTGLVLVMLVFMRGITEAAISAGEAAAARGS